MEESQKKYRTSEKGKATREAYLQKYRQSAEGKATRVAYVQKYRQSAKGKATREAYNKYEKGKVARKAKAQRSAESFDSPSLAGTAPADPIIRELEALWNVLHATQSVEIMRLADQKMVTIVRSLESNDGGSADPASSSS